MTILISSSTMDHSTDYVIDWIYYLNKDAKVIRINDDINYKISFEIDGIHLSWKNGKISFSEIDSFWFRRGRIKYHFNDKSTFEELRTEEEQYLEEYIHYKLKEKRCLTNYFNSDVNKLIVLEEAKKNGLNIPESYILENKKDLSFLLTKSRLITKNYLSSSGFMLDEGSAVLYTTEVTNDLVTENDFSPSLFQTNVEKKIELRIFYLNGKFWSMAIFSQFDEQTKTDFRLYNHVNPNKNVPFSLPNSIKAKLKRLMRSLDLDTGSIDMILTPDDKYVFLEVNPIGQFGMVSFPCNYNLEKEIAKYLCYEN